jgi:hypothetical protein
LTVVAHGVIAPSSAPQSSLSDTPLEQEMATPLEQVTAVVGVHVAPLCPTHVSQLGFCDPTGKVAQTCAPVLRQSKPMSTDDDGSHQWSVPSPAQKPVALSTVGQARALPAHTVREPSSAHVCPQSAQFSPDA